MNAAELVEQIHQEAAQWDFTTLLAMTKAAAQALDTASKEQSAQPLRFNAPAAQIKMLFPQLSSEDVERLAGFRAAWLRVHGNRYHRREEFDADLQYLERIAPEMKHVVDEAAFTPLQFLLYTREFFGAGLTKEAFLATLNTKEVA